MNLHTKNFKHFFFLNIHRSISFFTFFILIYHTAFADPIETFYGIVEVEEPVLLELIKSPAFQRLKGVHQYGVAYYTTHSEEYTRYEHSLGVFYLLRSKNCSLKEQIAGLLHDVSHTIFSHVGDWIFNQHYPKTDYHTLTQSDYLKQSGLSDILAKYGYSVADIEPKEELFPALEKSLPTLCADRIDYNLQGAYYRGYITYEEALRVFHEIQFIDGEWISNEPEILKKLVRFSIFMSQNCWGSGTEYVLSMWLAEAILRGLEIGAISMEEIRFGTDQKVWDRLLVINDFEVQKKMHMILNSSDYHRFVSKEEANLFIISKFRGIDPLVMINGKPTRLSTTDATLAEEFEKAKIAMSQGWFIKII